MRLRSGGLAGIIGASLALICSGCGEESAPPVSMNELTGTWVHGSSSSGVLEIDGSGGFELSGIDADSFSRALSTDRIVDEGADLEGVGDVQVSEGGKTVWRYQEIRFDFDGEIGDLNTVGSIPVFVGGDPGDRAIVFTNPDFAPKLEFRRAPEGV